ncbi:alpha/beta hydrolase [Desulfatibacillum aliphaticivorans]|uniref:alpha/beta hydrolase n=1 Tax=Desulfatibacillum aliphaticivorans TaxID=218208 RepID=UPI0004856A7E|nr:alpha/beta hydrolase [Desulfatibacillum aliphaticivorans]
MFWIILIVFYVALSLAATYLVHQMPRRPVHENPDWGAIEDLRIPAVNGGTLEVWRIAPDGPSRGIVVLAHGWSRNRDRMVPRARVLAKQGFTTVMHSARDHGNSSPQKWMQAAKFAEDIETVLDWIGEPVILYGHSAGAGGAIIAAYNRREQVRVLILEGCYSYTRRALFLLYSSFSKAFGILLGPMVLFWMSLMYGRQIDEQSPANLAPKLLMPVLLIHGEFDEKFPLSMAYTMEKRFKPGQAELFIGKGAGHSDCPDAPGYEDAVINFVNSQWKQSENKG